MKRFIPLALLLLLCIPLRGEKKKEIQRPVVPVPEVVPQIIPIETDHTQLILRPTPKGLLETLYYGARIGEPQVFLKQYRGRGSRSGAGPLAFPVAGGITPPDAALSAAYADGSCNTELYYTGHTQTQDEAGVVTTVISLKDYVTLLEVRLVYEAYRQEDVIAVHTEIRNGGKKAVTLQEYASAALLLSAERYLLTSFHGDWAKEMQMERTLLPYGRHTIESRNGTQATQPANPAFLLSLDTDRFSETEGRVIAGALEWSGNFSLRFTRDPSGDLTVIGGIHAAAAAYPLKPGEVFETPRMLQTFSNAGAGQASRNLHRWARKWNIYRAPDINPTLLNSWEGAYFQFNTQTLLGMIDDAAGMGLELFVLDDGWFGTKYPRNNSRQGLGDWEVNAEKLPEGIDSLASYAHGKGLKFGIWIEPEMVSPRSRLAEEHPDWVVRSAGREIPESRNQWVLDLSNPAVQDFVFGVFARTMALSDKIDYVKWDCNRPVYSFGSDYLGTQQTRFYVAYVQGFYKIVRRIRERYPDVILQCCASGGARVDYGALRYFNEVWTSDNTDALERVRIQYGTGLIYPACVQGSHVSAVPNHQTGNVTPLKFRLDVAAAGRLGMELQPRNLTEAEQALCRRCIESYKQYRDIVFAGDLYRLASPYEGDACALLFVSEDRSRAVLFSYSLGFRSRAMRDRTVRLQGLDAARHYRVRELNTDKSCWWGDGGIYEADYLMGNGMDLKQYKMYDSAIFLLEAQP